jgi:hypothetical protein
MKEPVGTELSKMIPDWAVQFEGKCGCRNMQAKMDHWGVVGCTAKKDIIVAHLMEQSDKLIPAFRLVPDTAKKIIAEQMLRMAIKRARGAS